MVTASYISPAMQELDAAAKENGLVFMNEIGLDPGIDHMSAMKVLDEIREKGGEIILFESFCGGLVAPESDTNLWNYKFTWNPRNVVLAGQGGAAKFIQEGKYKYIPYSKLFRRTEFLEVEGYGRFEAYANRDSLKYRSVYGLDDALTCYRGTIRRVGYSRAWDILVQLGMTDDSYIIDNSEEMTYREKVEAYVRSRGSVTNDGLRFGETRDEVLIPMNEIVPTTDGVVKANTKPITSEEIITTPIREVKTVVDLKQFTTVHKANKGAGKYPILKQATTKMVSVAELEKNPALAKPEFDSVAWEVVTYRGAIPVSQESIDDADVDLLSIVAENAGQIKLNTTNSAIAEVFKTFTAKTITDLDGLKAIQNVDLDPAYNVSLVVSQSFYNELDTLKDGNGRYMLQDSIISPSGKVFAGHSVFVVADTVLGNTGEAKAFVGDISRAVLFVDRKDLGLRWADNEIYGQYLQAVVRFDVKKADAKAGYFVTYTPAP